MGLLSALQFGQQSQWLPPWITPYGAPAQSPQQQAPFNPNWAATLGTSQPQAQPMQPAAPQARRRGPAPLSFTPQNAQMLSADPTVAVPYMDAQGQRQMGQTQFGPAPGQSQAQVRPPSWSERLGTWSESPLLQIGLSLLGNADNGGDWGAVGQDLRQFGQERTQRQRQENEDRRLRVQEGREDTLWNRSEQQNQGLERWVASLPPEQQARARANPQAAYAAFMEMEAQRNAPITPYQERQLGLEERQLADQRAARAQQMAYQNNQDQWQRRFMSTLGAADAGSVAEQGALVRQGITQVRPIIAEMRSIVEQYPDIMGSWINTNDRTQLVRMAGGDPARLAAMERFQGLATQLTLPQLEALRPATNLDFERVRATVADPQMSQRGALAFFDSQLQAIDRASAVSDSQGQWIMRYGSLSLPNENGQTWATANANSPFMQFNASAPDSIAGAGRGSSGATPPQGAIQRLRQNPTERERRLFDEAFGPGAAARALAGTPQGRRDGVYSEGGRPFR
jgi:hypothetical protein